MPAVRAVHVRSSVLQIAPHVDGRAAGVPKAGFSATVPVVPLGACPNHRAGSLSGSRERSRSARFAPQPETQAGRDRGVEVGVLERVVPQDRQLDPQGDGARSEEHTSELQSRSDLVCRLLLEKKKKYE